METLSVLRFDRFSAYLRLMRLHRPIGSLLLLWPTLWALWIVTARVAADAWLDTAEHEVIALSPNKQDILSVEAAREPGWMDRDFWENRPIILPTQNIISSGPI